MIPKISVGSDLTGLVKHLFDEVRHNDHANQRPFAYVIVNGALSDYWRTQGRIPSCDWG